jgi:hypothetical protein
MIKRLLLAAYHLDAWLHEHLGRPYTAILGIGLVFGIIDGVRGLTAAMADGAGDGIKVMAMVVFQVALLINQLGQFHEYRQLREARRAAKRAAQG